LRYLHLANATITFEMLDPIRISDSLIAPADRDRSPERSGRSAPDIDDGLAVDINRDACAHLFAGGDVVCQRGADFVEAVVAVSVNFVFIWFAPFRWCWGSAEQGEQRRAQGLSTGSAAGDVSEQVSGCSDGRGAAAYPDGPQLAPQVQLGNRHGVQTSDCQVVGNRQSAHYRRSRTGDDGSAYRSGRGQFEDRVRLLRRVPRRLT
jgi:hypothetical protein